MLENLADREKPWGTGHAILMAKDKIKGFFAVINGDDFYGRSAFFSCVDYLKTLTLSQKNAYAMVAYRLSGFIIPPHSEQPGIPSQSIIYERS